MDAEHQQQASSSSDTCPICLSPILILQQSYLDQCFHKFCYNCILQWAKFVPKHSPQQPAFVKCPLCKTKSSSVIYEYDGNSFKQHLINQNSETSDFFTKAHKYRLQCYYVEPGNSIGDINITRYWKSCKYRQPNQWLCSWVSREIQALIQENDVDIIVHHIIGVIDSWRKNEPKGSKVSYELKQEEFKRMVADAAKPFLRGRTERFVNELEMFVASGLNIEAYDKMYINHLGLKIAGINDDGDEELEERDPLIPLLSFSDEDVEESV
ncbi:uncharacterized protein LOC143580202 [Bidens hawaiensis]|uniref:uncharacterized protein LOC143580202 n=1 Tax=Bidens hawaiensis TaxID=980011 RepID=UPI00404929FB